MVGGGRRRSGQPVARGVRLVLTDEFGDKAVLVLHHAELLQTAVRSERQCFVCSDVKVMTEADQSAIDLAQDTPAALVALMHTTDRTRIVCCDEAYVRCHDPTVCIDHCTGEVDE
jgi:hypothetical protein|eukprot:COSAG01_NODE_2861_length_6959_cov_3.530321_6_plen_115_part_00